MSTNRFSCLLSQINQTASYNLDPMSMINFDYEIPLNDTEHDDA